MKSQIIFISIVLMVLSCQPDKAVDTSGYPDQMGEIVFDAATDDPDFRLCDEKDLVHSRVSLSYVGGRGRIEELSRRVFEENANRYEYNGYIVARFLVNCNGETGRLRFESLDDGFMEQVAPDGLIDLIRKSVKTLDEWTITKTSNIGKDHSKYLNFKIKNGQIDAIIH